jgi:hypothetical protein
MLPPPFIDPPLAPDWLVQCARARPRRARLGCHQQAPGRGGGSRRG